MYLSQHPFNTTGIQLVPKVRRDGFLSVSILHRIKCSAKSARISSLREEFPTFPLTWTMSKKSSKKKSNALDLTAKGYLRLISLKTKTKTKQNEKKVSSLNIPPNQLQNNNSYVPTTMLNMYVRYVI